jgi:hypothetical protein
MAIMGQFMMDEGIQSVVCSSESQGCGCRITFKGQSNNKESGKYSVSGNSLTTMPAGGDPETDDYCVDGTTMRVKPGSMMSMGDFAGTITMTRK